VARQKYGRRNRYQIQAHLPLPEPASQAPAVGGVLALLAGAGARLQLTGTGPAWPARTSRALVRRASPSSRKLTLRFALRQPAVQWPSR